MSSSYPQLSFQHSVLVVNDLAKSEAMIRAGLLSYPVQFEFCAGDEEQAFQCLKSSRPDLLLVSLEFQKGSVMEFAEKTREKWAHVPAIFLSEPHLMELQKSVLKMGAFDVIPHPSGDPADLIRRMDRAVRLTRKLKTRAESFIALHEESKAQVLSIADILDKKNELPLA